MYGPMTTAMIVQDKRRYGRGSSTNPARNADRFKAGGSTRDSNLLDAAESAAESTEKQPHVPTMQLEKGDSHSVTAFMTQLEDDIADATAGQDGEGNAVLEQVEEELEERSASKANSIPKPVQTYDKDNNLVRHGGILDCLFTPAATKKKEQAGYMDLLSKIDEQIKENNKI